MPLKDKEACKKYKAAWYQKNKERLLPKLKVQSKAWAKYHPEYEKAKSKRHYLKHKDDILRKQKEYWVHYGRFRFYSIKPEDFNRMYSEQNGKCAICKKDIPLKGRGTHIDHNETTGKVRGLLCNLCNPGLGLFKENILYLESAIEYLRRNS